MDISAVESHLIADARDGGRPGPCWLAVVAVEPGTPFYTPDSRRSDPISLYLGVGPGGVHMTRRFFWLVDTRE